MRIGTKIAVGFVLPLIVLIAIAAIAFRGTKILIASYDRLDHTQTVLSEINALLLASADAEASGRGFVITGEDRFLVPYRDADARIGKAQQALRELTADNPAEQGQLDQLEADVKDRGVTLDRIIAARQTGGFDAASGLVLAEQSLKSVENLRRTAAEVVRTESGLLAQRFTAAKTSGHSAMWALALGTVVALLLVAFASYLLTRSISGRMALLLEGTERIGKGDLAHRITLVADDELGELAMAFNRMAENRQRAEQELARQWADGQRVLEAITDTASRLASSTAEILSATTQQTAGVSQQAAAVAQTVATVTEVVQISEQASERARGVAERARRSDEVGHAGRSAVEAAVGVMSDAKEKADSVAESILALAERTQTVGEIVALVNDLADQTNLLALNAAIEAARAGEQGKGFSVVAGEVRALAEQSKKATVQVRQLLGEIQKTANQAVLSTEESTRSMNAAMRAAREAGGTIQSLGQVIAEVAQAVAQIEASSGQQTQALTQIHEAMRNVNEVSTQSLQSTRQAERAAQGLNALGLRLRELLDTLPPTKPRA